MSCPPSTPMQAVPEKPFSLYRPMIQATNGLTLSQVSAITGLEGSTVQNWIKRGFVAHPVEKKYHARQLARILLIAALRESMPLERIGAIMTRINGDADDESDDTVSEEQMYDYLCAVRQALGESGFTQQRALAVIESVTATYAAPDEAARQRLTAALLTMACACEATRLRRLAETCFEELDAIGK